MTADLTVVVPAYNGAATIIRTLDSLAAQARPVEVVVVDDGSTDATARLAREHPCRPTVLEQPNLGVGAARNRGLATVRSEWVAFLDQDDLWHHERAERLLDLTAQGHRVVCSREMAFADPADRVSLGAVGDGRERWPQQWVAPEDELERLVLAAVPPTGDERQGELEPITTDFLMSSPFGLSTSVVMRRDDAVTAGGCATFTQAVDYHLLLVSLTQLFGPITMLHEQLAFYRVHPGSATTSTPLAARFMTLLLALRHGGRLPPAPTSSPWLRDLWGKVGQSSLSPTDQLALLALSVPRSELPRQLARWTRSTARHRIAARRGERS